MRRTKLMFVSHESTTTGAPLFLVSFIKNLKAARPDYELHVFFCQDGDLELDELGDSARIYMSNKRNLHGSTFQKSSARVAHYAKFISTLLFVRPDLVYLNTVVNFGESQIARRLGFKVCIHVHEGLALMSSHATRVIASVKCAHHIIAGSKYVQSSIKRITNRESTVIYNGAGRPNSSVSRTNQQASTKLRLGVLGTVVANKGQIYAIEAVRALLSKGREVHLFIAGSIRNEAYLSQLQDFIARNEISEFVTIMGPVGEPSEFISSLDALLVPSLDEAFPTVILESFAVGTLVIASNVGGIPEIVDHEKTGLLFRRADSQHLAEIIDRTLFDKTLARDLTQNAKIYFEEKLDQTIAHRNLTNLIDTLVTAT